MSQLCRIMAHGHLRANRNKMNLVYGLDSDHVCVFPSQNHTSYSYFTHLLEKSHLLVLLSLQMYNVSFYFIIWFHLI